MSAVVQEVETYTETTKKPKSVSKIAQDLTTVSTRQWVKRYKPNGAFRTYYDEKLNSKEPHVRWKINSEPHEKIHVKNKVLLTDLEVSGKYSEIFEFLTSDLSKKEYDSNLMENYAAAFEEFVCTLQFSNRSTQTNDLERDVGLLTNSLPISVERFDCAPWADVINDVNELSVINALADPQWDFRTISGMAKETQFSSEFIKNVLDKYPQYVRRSKVPNHDGDSLYTSRSKKETWRERFALWLIYIKKSLG